MEPTAMKCIKDRASGKVERVSNSEAAHKVASGKADYCPKSEWKAARTHGAEG
jgi:hypothetical protein